MKRHAGFTLLEMLAALIIFAICGTLLLSGVADVRSTLSKARDRSEAVVVVRSVLAMAQLHRLVPGASQGVWDQHLRWRMQTSLEREAPGGLALYRIEIWIYQGATVRHYITFDIAQSHASS